MFTILKVVALKKQIKIPTANLQKQQNFNRFMGKRNLGFYRKNKYAFIGNCKKILVN
jgi:hypothetical protein